MGKRGNALLILGALILDVFMCVAWYYVMFPSEPVPTLETVWNTITALVGTLGALFVSYIIYDSCVSEEV